MSGCFKDLLANLDFRNNCSLIAEIVEPVSKSDLILIPPKEIGIDAFE